MRLGIVPICVENRASHWQGPPSSVRVPVPLSGSFVGDQTVTYNGRSIHTTIIVTTVRVRLHFYQLLCNIWPSSSSSLAKNFNLHFLISYFFLSLQIYTLVYAQRFGWVIPSSG